MTVGPADSVTVDAPNSKMAHEIIPDRCSNAWRYSERADPDDDCDWCSGDRFTDRELLARPSPFGINEGTNLRRFSVSHEHEAATVSFDVCCRNMAPMLSAPFLWSKPVKCDACSPRDEPGNALAVRIRVLWAFDHCLKGLILPREIFLLLVKSFERDFWDSPPVTPAYIEEAAPAPPLTP